MGKIWRGGTQPQAAGNANPRAKIKRALVNASPALAGLLLGVAIGLNARTETPHLPENHAVESETTEAVDTGALQKELDGIAKTLIGNCNEKQIDSALRDLEGIVKNPDFDFEKSGLIKSLIEKTGENSPYAIDALEKLMRKNEFTPEMLDEELITELAEAIGKTAEKAGEKSIYALNELAGIFGLDEGVVDCCGESMGAEKERQANINPEGLLKAVKTMAERSWADDRLLWVLQIMKAFTRNENIAPGMINGELAHRLHEIDKLAHSFSEKGRSSHRTCLVGTILTNPKFEISGLGGKLIEEVGELLETTYSKADGRSDEAVDRIDYILHKQSLEALRIVVGGARDRTSLFEMLGIMEMMTKNGWYELENEIAGALCDSFEAIGKLGSWGERRAAVRALESFVQSDCFEPAMLELARAVIERGRNTARELRELNLSLGGEELVVIGPGLSVEDYRNGRRLAEEILHMRHPPAISILNFGDALRTASEERIRELNNRFGIEYFLRYSKDLLEELHKNTNLAYKPDRPVLLEVFNKADWNGAFYNTSYDSTYQQRSIERLMEHYRVIVVEIRSEAEFYRRVREVAEIYGRIEVLSVNGHGTPSSINFGNYTESAMIDRNDGAELSRLRRYFAENPTIILNACSTGAQETSIGGLFYRIFGGRVFALMEDGAISRYTLDWQGRITGVEGCLRLKGSGTVQIRRYGPSR